MNANNKDILDFFKEQVNLKIKSIQQVSSSVNSEENSEARDIEQTLKRH